MIRGIYQNAAAMQLLQDSSDVTANNMANVNTAGFKKKNVFFQQLISAEEALRRNQLDYKLPDGKTPTYTDFSNGKLEKTENPLDLAIQGQGFYRVQTPEGQFFTRAASFSLDGQGNLVTPQGYQVLGEAGPIQITGEKVEVNSDGAIIVDGVFVNQLQLTNFDTNLATKMNDNLYSLPEGIEQTEANAEVLQGFVERSNVSVVHEMVSLIRTQRHYEANQKLITAQDETLRKTVNEIGK